MEQEIDIMQVLRVPPLGKIEVLIGNDRFQHISEVKDSETRHRLLAAIGELVVFADGYEALEKAGLAPPLTSQDSESTQEVSQPLDEKQAEFLSSLQQEKDALYLTDAESSGSQRPVDAAPSDRTADTGPLSIAGQINPLIKKHVATNPKLVGRKVELEQNPEGGLTINVDGRHYDRPDQIEDAEIRQAIRAALKEWDST